MKSFAIAFVVLCSFALSACTTTQGESIDATIQNNLPQVCSAAETAHLAFVAFVEADLVSDRTAQNEALAWNNLQRICANPEEQTAVGVLIAAIQAYGAIARALEEAEEAEA